LIKANTTKNCPENPGLRDFGGRTGSGQREREIEREREREKEEKIERKRSQKKKGAKSQVCIGRESLPVVRGFG
jgi:hypothetical protein